MEDKSALKKQNETMFYYYDHLKTLPKKELELLLEYNDQQIPPGTDGVSLWELLFLLIVIEELYKFLFFLDVW